MVDLHRRKNFKTELKDDFASLCSGEYPVNQYLFGPELGDKVKDVSETLKVAFRVNKEKRYKSFNGKSRKSFPFLGRSPFINRRGGGGRDSITINQQ